MRFYFNRSLYALSYILDCVEHDLIGVTTNHGKRVAALSILLGRHYGLRYKQSQALAACAILHDCALMEYVHDEYGGSYARASRDINSNTGSHCKLGEKYLKSLPINENIKGAVLYHHENADGSGPFEKKGMEIPLYARIIHLADNVDAIMDLSLMNDVKEVELFAYIQDNSDILFDAEIVNEMIKIIKNLDWSLLQNEKIDLYLQGILPEVEIVCTPQQLMDYATVFARITDYKSHFTCTHSIGIAQKAEKMALFYGADSEMVAKLYFAGALHDIGKLVVDRDVLEKPDKLTEDEYRHIKNHAYNTYRIFSEIKGMEDITRWASRHHEKLDGSGYPFGLKGRQLDFWDRMMACIDIYQALTEERPYKKGMSHEKAIFIIKKMVSDGKLDEKIVDDIEVLFEN